jgi:hypothetical protein
VVQKNGDSAGNEESGDQAGDHMLSRIFLEHHERLQAGLLNPLVCPWDVICAEESEYDQEDFGSFFHVGFLSKSKYAYLVM